MSLSINPAAIGCTLFGSGKRYSDGFSWLEQLTITTKSEIVSDNHFYEGFPILSLNDVSDCRASQLKIGSAYIGITGDNGIILNGFLQQSFLKTASTPSVLKMGSEAAAKIALLAALSKADWILQQILTYEFGICQCPDGSTPPPLLTRRIYFGNASPPPPPPRKKMQCCDCNTIATIVENQSIAQLAAEQKLFEDLKDHIDKRALEIIIKDLEHLKALDFEQFLRAIMQRINESESNLWNGPQQ